MVFVTAIPSDRNGSTPRSTHRFVVKPQAPSITAASALPPTMRRASSKRFVSMPMSPSWMITESTPTYASTRPFAQAVSPRACTAHSEKPPSNTANVKPITMRTVRSGPTRGSLSAVPSSEIAKPFAGSALTCSRRAFVSDSGRNMTTSIRLIAASPAATNAGTLWPNTDSAPPVTGPRMKPMPNAAPTSPKALPRSFSSVMSVMYA